MKISVKYFTGSKWALVPAEDIKGMSIAQYARESKQPVVAAMFDNDEKPLVFISNNDKDVSQYKSRGVSLHVNDLIDLLGTEVVPNVLIETFPGSDFMEVQQIEAQHDLPLVPIKKEKG